jgi:hypothetical protein
VTEEQIERATDAVEAERHQITIDFCKRNQENEENKRKQNGKPFVSCWPLGREFSRRCAVAALSAIDA